MPHQKCKRKVVEIGGENYYLVLGSNFVMATVPRENDPAMSKERMVVETVCRELTKMMGGEDAEEDNKTSV